MGMLTAWTIWFLLTFCSFIALESYAGVTNQWTLSQTVWGLQDAYPWTTTVITVGVAILMIHLIGHRWAQIEPLGRLIATIIGLGDK